MTRVESGPAATDRNWQAVRALVFLAFAAWFLYDGWIGWPNAMRVEAQKQLPTLFDGKFTYDQLPDTPVDTDFKRLDAQLGDLDKRGQPLKSDLARETLGQPQHTRPEAGPVGARTEFFVSKYGYATIRMEGDRINRQMMSWTPWKGEMTRDKIVGQFFWAAVPGVVGLLFLWKLYKAATLRVVVDESGLTYSGRAIPFAEITALRDYSPKGWIDLYYRPGGAARQKRLRLDNEKIARFGEVVDAICEAKGFANEFRVFERDQEAAEAAETEESLGGHRSDSVRRPEDQEGDDDVGPPVAESAPDRGEDRGGRG